MSKYLVSFLKDSELYESKIIADNSDDAREKIAIKYNIPIKFEIGTIYNDEYNHVGAVIKI